MDTAERVVLWRVRFCSQHRHDKLLVIKGSRAQIKVCGRGEGKVSRKL
jgi:hypothetical protein